MVSSTTFLFFPFSIVISVCRLRFWPTWLSSTSVLMGGGPFVTALARGGAEIDELLLPLTPLKADIDVDGPSMAMGASRVPSTGALSAFVCDNEGCRPAANEIFFDFGFFVL
jgi:hypothetical protein